MERIKLLFLDIDGVLNHNKFFMKMRKELTEANISSRPPYCWFDKGSVSELNNIIKKTNAKIVVSSSWRFDSDLQRTFDMVGIVSPIFGKTPSLMDECRGQEIKAYMEDLTNNGFDIINYVILDDDNDMLEEQICHFFQTNANEDGLNTLISNNIIKFLNETLSN